MFIHFVSILKNRLILSIYISAKTFFAGHEAVELWGTRSERRTTRCYLRRRACRSTPRSTCRGTGGRSRRIFEENPLTCKIIVMKICISSGLWNVLFVNFLFTWDILCSHERKTPNFLRRDNAIFLTLKCVVPKRGFRWQHYVFLSEKRSFSSNFETHK